MAKATVAVAGAWRDRTNLYISYRQSYAHHPAKRTKFAPSTTLYSDNDDEARTGLMAAQDDPRDAVIEMDVLPPRWLDLQDDVSTHLAAIAPKMKRLDALHNKHVLPGFDDESVKAAEAREIESITQDITRDFAACQRAIKRIDVLAAQGGGSTQAEETMARNLKRALAARVGEVSAAFRKKQSAYMKKLRQLGGMPGLPSSSTDRTSTPLGAVQNPYTDPAMLDSEADRSTAQTTLLQTSQLRQRGKHDAAIAHREAEIGKIAQGVIDLSNLFTDLQTMVIDQGTVLDRIDYNVERTVEHVKAADQEIRVATNYQKRSTRRKVIFLLILIVVGLFILLLVKPRRHHEARPPPGPEHAHEEILMPPRRRDDVERRSGKLEEIWRREEDSAW